MQKQWDSIGHATSTATGNTSAFSASSTLPSIPYTNGRNTPSLPSSRHTQTPPTDNDDSGSSDDEYGQIRLLSEHVDALSLATDGGHEFRGKSSLAGVLTQAAQTIPSLSQAICSMAHPKNLPRRRPVFWTAVNVRKLACFCFVCTDSVFEHREASVSDPQRTIRSSHFPNPRSCTN